MERYSYDTVPMRTKWERWFAWYPIKINDKRIWFKFVYRRYVYQFVAVGKVGLATKRIRHYGTIMDVLKNN